MEFELEPFGGILSEADATNALGPCDAAEPQTRPDAHTNQDTVTCREAGVSNKGVDVRIDNGRSETEFQEAGAFSGMEDLDFMSQDNIPFGLHAGKFRPKPKMKAIKEKPSTDTSHPEVESVMHSQTPELVPSYTGYANVNSVSAFPADDLQDNSMRFDDFITLDPTSEISMNEESINLAKTYSDGPVPRDTLHSEDVPEILTELDSNCRRGEASTSSDLLQKCKRSATADEENNDGKSSGNLNNDGKSLRKLRKKVSFQLIDEPDGEVNENGGFSGEPPTDSNIGEVEDRDDDDEYRVESDEEFRVESMSQKKRAPRKSKKSGVENGKPVQKRKKANEAADQSTKEPPKKFSHSTRRNRRRVDKVLLETPEDEIDPQRLPIKDLILLAEYKERLASKEAETSKTPLTNLRSYNSFPRESSYNGEATFVSEQGRGSDDDQPSYEVPTDPFVNYQSFMDKTPSTRWSKQDTELFYEAVRQFGTDFSMIQQLFPGRTRHQVKLKFKKEERQYPLRLSEALTSRAKDHSHFHLVIERLQQASQAEDAYVDDEVARTGKEEEEIVELTTQAKEEVAKPEQDGEVVVEDQEADLGEVHSPAKSDAGDDNLYDWSQYKSDY
ncbi:transcription factor TFIIIB component B''-like isoform X8 [Carya illinoinensis]|nr:transcription factor TFIIIB component B''-like isoform X8 [Carya illinoinensis]